MKTKLQYYNEGYSAAFSRRIVFAVNAKRSWQKQAFMDGYRSGVIYLEAQALLNGFADKWEYQEYLIKQSVLKAQEEEERQFAYAEKQRMYPQ